MFLWLSESKNLFPTLPPEKKKKLFTTFFFIILDALKSSSLILNVLLLSHCKRKLSVYFKWQRPEFINITAAILIRYIQNLDIHPPHPKQINK